MPLYEYLCASCRHRFEVIQKFSDAPIDVCPACGGRVQKVLSSPAFQFKGSGWYITDYARKSQAEAGKGADGGGEKSETADKPEKAEKGEKAGAKKAGDTSAGSTASGGSAAPSTPKT